MAYMQILGHNPEAQPEAAMAEHCELAFRLFPKCSSHSNDHEARWPKVRNRFLAATRQFTSKLTVGAIRNTISDSFQP